MEITGTGSRVAATDWKSRSYSMSQMTRRTRPRATVAIQVNRATALIGLGSLPLVVIADGWAESRPRTLPPGNADYREHPVAMGHSTNSGLIRGQLPLRNTAYTTRPIVTVARMPWMRMTGRGKCRSGGTAMTLAGIEPGAA